MKLSQYGYDFAPEMLAKHPTENRDDSRLMVIDRAKGTIEHRIFKDIIEYFDEKTSSYSTTPKSSRHASTATRRRRVPRSRSSCCAN